MQRVGSCEMLNHCLDHELKEEPGAVSDGLPGRVSMSKEINYYYYYLVESLDRVS